MSRYKPVFVFRDVARLGGLAIVVVTPARCHVPSDIAYHKVGLGDNAAGGGRYCVVS